MASDDVAKCIAGDHGNWFAIVQELQLVTDKPVGQAAVRGGGAGGLRQHSSALTSGEQRAANEQA